MRHILLISLTFICFTGCSPVKKSVTGTAHGFSFEKVITLDSIYTETSGLEIYKNTIITHNDSGDLPSLYFLDLAGKGIGDVTYDNMYAIDWEDITKDKTHLYVADIGNNYGDRKDLAIYKIALTDLTDKNAPVQKLSITYPDQIIFDRNEQQHPYDAESIVAIDDSLYLFSKDWKGLSTVVYQIDKNSSSQIAKVIMTNPVNGLITGATFNGTDRVMLCGYTSTLDPFIVPVSYSKGSFTIHKKIMLPLKNGAQIEAITYVDTDTSGNEIYYLSSEAVHLQLGDDEATSDAQLYKLTISPFQ
jgi:hypothetical protein